MTATDRLDRWGVRIATWSASPGETALAAQTTRAYAVGGAPRRTLFSPSGPAPGGMGGGTASVLPAVLDGLAYAADALKSALGSPQLSNVLSVTGLLVGLRAHRSGAASDHAQTAPASTESPQPGEDTTPDPGASSAVPDPGASSAGPSLEVMRAALRMSERLRARGIEPAEADELAARVTAQFLAEGDPAEAAAFLDALVGEEPPQPDVSATRLRQTGPSRFIAAASGLLSRVGRRRTTP